MQIKRDSLLLRIIFYNDIAIIFTSLALALVFSLMVFSSMEQRLADTAREKVFLLYKAYVTEAKDSRETFRMVTNSVFQLAGTGIVENNRLYYDQIAKNISHELMKHSYERYSNSRVTLVNGEGTLLGRNSSERSYQILERSFIQEWQNSKYDRKDMFFYKKDNRLFFRFITTFYESDFQNNVFVILDLPMSSYSIENLREFIGMNEEDKILVSVSGHYYYGDLDYETGGELLDSFQITRFAPEGFEYFFNQKEINKHAYYMAFYKIRDLDSKYIASLGVAISKEKFLTTKYMVSALMIFIVSILIVISTTVCTKLFAKLLEPLTAILDAVYDIGRGNYKINLEEDAVYEIRNLSNAMEKLAKNISLKENQLKLHNDSLEKNLNRIDAIQKILMGVNLEQDFQLGMKGFLSALTSEAGLGYSRAIYLEYDREKNILQAKDFACNSSLVAECLEDKEKLKVFSFQLQEIDRILPLLKVPCDSQNYLGKSLNENRILYENDKAYRFPFGNDLFHSLGISHFIILPLYRSENMKSCILLDYYIREREITQEEIELLTLLLLNVNIQLKNKEVEDRKLHFERTSTMEKMSVHFMKGREKLFSRIESLVDKVEKNGYNKKITLEEITRLKRDFYKIKFDHSILEEYSNFSKKHFEMISVEEFMKELAKYVQEYMDKYEINFSQFISCNGYFYADKSKLFKAFIELLKNSSEAILTRNRLDKKINIVAIEDKKSNQILINIMDNGIGMYPEEVKEINKAFESYQETTAMGLGLSIVSMVIHEHKGSIAVTSKLDEGTDVKIILNIYKGEQHE